MNITPRLNLNKHPKDCTNLSFVNALNVKLSDDESCVVNEEAIRENSYIKTRLTAFYQSVGTYDIVGIISCNNELVLIVKPSNTEEYADIFRYREFVNGNTQDLYCAYGGINNPNRFKYHGGLIKGAFTYNVEDSLIIAITEYDVTNVKIPLRTINLGNYNDSTIYNDRELPDAKLAMSPELTVPSVNNLDYLPGSAYKGWYYMFIRYKINTVDYTQWHSIGNPIYIDTLEQYQIVRYCFNRDTKFASNPLNNIVSPPWPDDGYGVGCSDYFSNGSDIAKETFKVDLYFNGGLDYSKYQIGLICASKSYTKAFRTADIFLDKNFNTVGVARVQQYVLDNKSLIEYNVNDLITDNFNYFNSRNIVNYQNKLYISNYIEDNANNDDIPQTVIDNINVSLIPNYIRDYGLVYDTAVINTGTINQYDTYNMTVIPMHTYLKVAEETIINVTAVGFPLKQDKAGRFYIVSDNQTPGFAFVQYREPGPLGSVITINYGKPPDDTKVYINIPDSTTYSITTITIDTSTVALNGGMRYINTNTNFKDRKKQSSLIPGEVYNLFIHFVNSYNHATNGYKLNNNTIWVTEDQPNVEIIPIPFNFYSGSDDLIYYAAMPVDANVAITDYDRENGYNINVQNIKFYKQYNSFNTKPTLTSKVSSGEEQLCIDKFITYFSSYANVKFLNVKWYQISYGPGQDRFHLFINNNGDRLFKVPVVESFDSVWDGFPDEVEEFKTYNVHTLLKLSINNIEIPEGYDGYYISYEKFEGHSRTTGLLTRSDFRSQDYINKNGTIANLSTANGRKSDVMFFYSSTYDISDTIRLDYNIMRIEAINCFKYQDIPEWDYFQRNHGFGYVHDMNKPQTEKYGSGVQRTYSIPNYKIAVADSAIDNRMGLGTALQLVDSYALFPSYNTDDANNNKILLYRVTLLNTTRDIYMSNNKKLVRLTDTMYRIPDSPVDFKHSTGYVQYGYNGHYSYDGVIIYENIGLSFNTADNKARMFVNSAEFYKSEVPNDRPHTYQNDIPFLAYLQMPICSETFFESKSFKSAPTPIIYNVKTVESRGYFAKGSMVTPVNTIDLFENRQGSADQFNPKTYSNYRDDLVSIEKFDKTVRRSNVIQDESRANGWRTFPIEGYKNITENKGKITNIVGVGFIFLVHTQHSMFQFNIDNTLKTQDKDIQLLQPDIFDVSYKEVFTSDKGFGGLQDDKSYILDQFGYIFYSESTNRIHKFDNGTLDYIDVDIVEWLDKYKPVNVRMANDKENNRILIKFDYRVGNQIKYTVISYNYNAKYFVAQHSYYFNEAFHTETKVYLKCDISHTHCSLHNFDITNPLYGSYDNTLQALGTPTVCPSKMSIIINDKYSIVKFLEFITYKLVKYKNNFGVDFTTSPVEEGVEPFAGNTLTVYNNQINTGLMDINVNVELAKNAFGQFDKPYWDLGVWNFSYLFNKGSQLPEGLSADVMSRLFGNYFVVEFTFTNADGLRIEFEDLNYNISES